MVGQAMLDHINRAGLLVQKMELTNDPYLKEMYRSEYEIEKKNIQFIKRMGSEYAHRLVSIVYGTNEF